ncbi:acetyl-CoA C-acetyltransferase [Comamonas sp. BIGb0152]|uniref:thiolase family protein n=1 Tax=Comamonas sp. BIGb0152 TaxID=2940601 RepID=UPI0021670EA1|nr:beta-ketoacyl synthase N-terminal-like domain-containing protein [Comamonas sp. BIGb0152]MCS4292497.1 acetyl-CoA C-acetyltransferase [Comamonas sp. BIGb0152]
MPAATVFIPSHARSAVVPVGGAFKHLQTHEIAAPVLQALLQRAGLPAAAVDAVVLGNALGAGGNPARMLALAGQLPLHCAAYTVDTQCCAGLDAVALGASLVASGQAEVVVAGGAEAWSRAPIRATRPLQAGDSAAPYERPPFAPPPHDDPDLLVAAARYAASAGYSRAAQDRYAAASHARALASADVLAREIIPVAGVLQDAFPRALSQRQLDRMPVVAQTDADIADEGRREHAVSTVAISPKADAAALVLLVSEGACRRWGLQPAAQWLGHQSLGGSPAMPLVLAADAAQRLLQRQGMAWPQLAAMELHDAFAVQGLQWQALLQRQGADGRLLNRHGGGIARGHPIGASAAIALVRVLADLQQTAPGALGALGLAAVAGAGGLGSATLVRQAALLY